MPLRNYQAKTVDKILASMRAGNRSIVVQQPPRTGKTVIMADIAKRTTARKNTVLFVVHRQEIIEQARKTFIKWGVDMNYCKLMMIQTAIHRLESIDPPDLLLIDEAHHAKSKSYMKLIEYCKHAYKLLFTATPTRTDGSGFDDIATDLIQGESIQWLIDNGFLAPVDYYAPADIDESKLKIRAGDFTKKSIDEAFKPKIYGDVVNYYHKLADGKQAIVYTAGVEMAKRIAKTFNTNGVSAVAVDGNTSSDDRKDMVDKYRNGEIKIMTNAELFTEGLDLPNVDCVIMLRPTQSLSLYLQFAMRSMNPRQGKRAIIIDHVNNVKRFGLPTDERKWKLTGSKKQAKHGEQVAGKSITTCPECFGSFYRNGDKCPLCGAKLEREVKEMQVDKNAQLEKINSKKRVEVFKKILQNKLMMEVADKKPDELKSYAQLKAYAKLHDYKPGWAYYQAKMKGWIK